MRLHRFYITEEARGDEIKIENEDLIHQWRNVFRYTTGGQVIVFNGDGHDYLCLISEIYNRSGVLTIVSKKKSLLPEKKVTLAMALVKKDTFEWITEKATELGVTEIIPLVAERSEKKSIRMDRLEKIAIEAAEQSGRGDVPHISEPVSIQDFLNNPELNTYTQKIIYHTNTGKQKEYNHTTDHTLICIGPEGGWSDAEITLFQSHNFTVHSLGSLVLRAETAAIAAMTLVNLG